MEAPHVLIDAERCAHPFDRQLRAPGGARLGTQQNAVAPCLGSANEDRVVLDVYKPVQNAASDPAQPIETASTRQAVAPPRMDLHPQLDSR